MRSSGTGGSEPSVDDVEGSVSVLAELTAILTQAGAIALSPLRLRAQLKRVRDERPRVLLLKVTNALNPKSLTLTPSP